MLKKSLLAGVAVVAVSMPAFAQSYFGFANTPGANEYAPDYSYGYAQRRGHVAMGTGYDAYAYAGPIGARPGQCWVSTHNSRGYGYWGSCNTSNMDTDAGLLGQARPDVSLVPPH